MFGNSFRRCDFGGLGNLFFGDKCERGTYSTLVLRTDSREMEIGAICLCGERGFFTERMGDGMKVGG